MPWKVCASSRFCQFAPLLFLDCANIRYHEPTATEQESGQVLSSDLLYKCCTAVHGPRGGSISPGTTQLKSCSVFTTFFETFFYWDDDEFRFMASHSKLEIVTLGRMARNAIFYEEVIVDNCEEPCVVHYTTTTARASTVVILAK